MKRALIALVLVPVAGVGLLLVGDAARPRQGAAPIVERPAFSRPKTMLAVASATAAAAPPKPEAKPAAAPAPEAGKDEPSPERLAKLLALATDGATADADREAALAEIARSPYANAETVARLARLAGSATADLEARYEATGALRDLALREDLGAATRAALLEVAASAPSTDLRAGALGSVRASGATEAELGKLTAFLGDPDALVRVSAALVLETADGAARTVTGPAIEQAFSKETDPAVGDALVSAALRAAAGDPAILDRLAATEAARAMPEAAKKIARFRALMAAGETDPARIEKLAAAN
jgi:pyruvate dehydrogenase E2 component (dihydrolipoamide acetyltransferase)